MSISLCLLGVVLALPLSAVAQVNYVVHFEMDNSRFLVGGPVFCNFTIRNTGLQTLAFRYRSPSRVLESSLEQEPRFRLSAVDGRRLPDPAPAPCGGAKGTIVYGSVTLPPGQLHTERWLLNQWGQISKPGRYHVRAERRLPLFTLSPTNHEFSEKPVAYALAIDDLTFDVEAAGESQLEAAFQPFLSALEDPKEPDPAEAALVITALPHPFLLQPLIAMASATHPGRWDRKQALEGLARLGTPAAWQAVLKIACGEEACADSSSNKAHQKKALDLRGYAVLLLAEKRDSLFLPPLLELASHAPDGLSGDVLRALGFFHDPRAYQALYDKLHSPDPTDRMNAILGLKNAATKEVVPALIAMLNDPEPTVRQVANFALQGITNHKIALSNKGFRMESAQAAELWHAWWRENAASFVPKAPVVCRDW